MSDQILAMEDQKALREAGLLDRWLKKLVVSRLSEIQHGELTLIDGSETMRFGDRETGPCATVLVQDPRLYRTLASRGPMGGAQSYMEGYWTTSDLTGVIRLLAGNRDVLNSLRTGIARIAKPANSIINALRRNTKEGSRRNIGAHYDLGNDFFELFLDPTMTYSSGIFEREDATMEEASIAKYDRICQKLHLRPDDHVLEIGSGWGGFAIHAASHYGCRVTTTTISERQHALASERVAAAGLEDRIDLRFQDYRDLDGSYSKLVSIEMIEAVGADHLETFMEVCASRLELDGIMCLQAITHRDQDYEESLKSVEFIKRYIFPGGQLVSIGALTESAAKTSDLRMTHLEDITPHYAETLKRWRERMRENIDAIRALDLPERFIRMWEYYLCYCEGGFRERGIATVQVVFERHRTRRDAVLGSLDEVPQHGHAPIAG